MPLQLQQVGLVDLLESDPRPTFVVDLRASTTTLISTSPQTDEPHRRSIAYANPSLIAYSQLLNLLVSYRQKDRDLFWSWVVTPSPPPNEFFPGGGIDGLGGSSFWYLNILWTKSVVRGLWVVVGANEEPPSSERPHKMLQQTPIPTREPEAPSSAPSLELSFGGPKAFITESKVVPKAFSVLTSYLDREQLSFLNLLYSRSWIESPLGSLDQWPACLLQTFCQIITDPHPAAIYWGDSKIVIYNHAFSRLCGTQHLHLLGRPMPSVWSEAETVPQSLMALLGQRNEWMMVQSEALLVIPSGGGARQEAHINSSTTPIIDSGECVGFLQSVRDVTRSRIWERRAEMLCSLNDTLLSVRDVKSYWQKLIEGLEQHSSAFDVPLAILYSCSTPSDPDPLVIEPNTSPKASCLCRLEGSLGIPRNHPLIPDILDFGQPSTELARGFHKAFVTREKLLLQTSDSTLSPDLFSNLPLRSSIGECQDVVICPIRLDNRTEPRALLLLGLNPHRPYDSDYKRYISLLDQTISACLASATTLEAADLPQWHPDVNGIADSKRISMEIAASGEDISSDEMAGTDAKTDEPMNSLSIGGMKPGFTNPEIAKIPPQISISNTTTKEQEIEKLQRMAELAAVGICETDLNGRLIEANKFFFDLCGIPKVDDLATADVRPWEMCVPEEQKTSLIDVLGRLVKDGMPQTTEVRLNTSWSAQDSTGKEIQAPRWVLATFMPIHSMDGTIHAIHGCFSDVSAQKWQLESERRRKEEALESKRQQENFMDMTSHEMRNPLGAIIHCADAIVASLSQLHDPGIPASVPLARTHPTGHGSNIDQLFSERTRIVEESIDNAETIIACAQHQKRIIDDLLTVSKLDSKLIAVTPCTVDPLVMVRNALKMFEVEARRVDVDLTMTVDHTFADMGHDHFDFDPSRAKQVLINLLTNALKFTKNRPVRNVSVLVKASRDRPTNDISGVRFMPRSYDEPDYEQPDLVGRTDPVFLIFEVKDTGRGLSEDEMRHLFNRFQQASSFTHVNHGGSGLGLFISRRLTELQNGAIGVSSAPNSGSTFVFFIEAYLPSIPAVEETALSTSASAVALSTAAVAIAKSIEPEPMCCSPLSNGPCIDRRAVSMDSSQRLGPSASLDGILVVEDNNINQQITKRGLTQKGFRVDVANHGLEALEKLTGSRPRGESSNDLGNLTKPPHSPPFNLILMDIEMPVQDGLTCARKIRELEDEGMVFSAHTGRIPIIAVSAHAKETQVGAALKAGCDDVLVKPYRMSELIEKMEALARKLHPGSPNVPVSLSQTPNSQASHCH